MDKIRLKVHTVFLFVTRFQKKEPTLRALEWWLSEIFQTD